MSGAANWVQATPDRACVFFLSQRAGAPDPARQTMIAQKRQLWCLWGMSNTRRLLLGTIASLAVAVTLVSVYQLGYRQGGRDALDWEFSAVVGGKVVPVGHGSNMLRARRAPLRPTQTVNVVSEPFALTHK